VELLERARAQTLNLAEGRTAPRLWWTLGRALAAAGRLEEAAAIFQDNLSAHPELKLFGWQQQAALSGVYAALGRPAEAARARAEAEAGIRAVAATLGDERRRAAFSQAALAKITTRT
jgi:hypothetical protein